MNIAVFRRTVSFLGLIGLVLMSGCHAGSSDNPQQITEKSDTQAETWAIRLQPGMPAGFLKDSYDIEILKPIGSLADTYLIILNKPGISARLETDRRIVWMEKQVARERVKKPENETSITK